MVWVPNDSVVVVTVATPPDNVPVPIVAEVKVSTNDTVPVGVPVPGPVGETIAVNVTDCPLLIVFDDEVTVLVVFALLTTCGLPFNEPVLPLKFPSPP
jgi:hypothetical protein